MAKRGTSRRYSPEFKRDAVALLRSSGRSIAQVAKELGVSDMSLSTWAANTLLRPSRSAASSWASCSRWAPSAILTTTP
jgi:transposase